MVAIRVDRFAGMLPVKDPSLLNDPAATQAVNVRVESGVLRGVPTPRALRTLNPSTRKVFRLPYTAGGAPVPLSDLDNSFYVQFSDPDTDVIRSPIVNDTTERYYWCSPSTGLKFATRAQLLAGSAGLTPGVPAPASAPVVLASPPIAPSAIPVPGTGAIVDGKNTGAKVTRSYVYTYAGADFETEPSPPFDSDGATDQQWFVWAMRIPAPASGATQIRIYRTSPATLNDTVFYRVATLHVSSLPPADIAFGTTSWTDPTTDASIAGNPSISVQRRSVIRVTRSYVYTHINEYGEESAPSPPAEATGRTDRSWRVSGFSPASSDPQYAPPTQLRIYRTITASSGTTRFYRVATVPINTTLYIDTSQDNVVSAGPEAQSVNWAVPPSMDGIAAMANGIVVGFKGNTLYFAENYRPHAWPPQYAISVQHPIVGIAAYGNSCVVCTTGAPAVVTGIRSSSISFTQSTGPMPCASRRSIAATVDGVSYATDAGLVVFSPAGGRVATTGFIARDQWSRDYRPTTITGVIFAGDYVALRDTGVGFMFPAPIGAEPSGLGGVVDLGGLTNPHMLQIDAWTGRCLYIETGQLYEWFPTNTSPRTFRWRSKEFYIGRPANIAAAQVFFETPQGVTPAVTLRVWADGRLVYDQPVIRSEREISLPSGFRASTWQFEVESNVEVESVCMASTMRELKRV